MNNITKLRLITDIEARQQRRWGRIRFFWRSTYYSADFRRFLIQQEVNLIREQRERLKEIKREVYQ